MFINEDYGVAEEALEAFLQAWSEGKFEDAYDMLAVNSTLKQGLTRDAWGIRRRTWAEDAQPARMRFEIVTDSDFEVEPMLPTEGEGLEPTNNDELLEVFWSIEMKDTPLSSTLKELPEATVVYQEIGRHWFWTRYKLVEENRQWRIQDMIDEGAAAKRLSAADIEQRIDTLTAIIRDIAADLGLTNVEADNEEAISDFLTQISQDESSFEAILDQAEEVRWITLRGMHYSDALIVQAPQDEQGYSNAVAQATSMEEWERAASYLEQIIQRFPGQRGDALRILAIAQSNLAEEYEEERAKHFHELVEQTLRRAIEADHAVPSYTMLADLLLSNETHLDEADKLLQEAKARATEPKDTAMVEYSQGKLAEAQDDLQRALGHYQRSAKLDPQQPEIWTSLGNVQTTLGQTHQAMQSYQRAIKEGTEEPDAYIELAAIYIKDQKIAKAREILEEALSLFPEEADLYATYAMLELQSGNLRSAEEYLGMAEEIDPELEIVQDTRLVFDTIKAQQKAAQPKNKAKSSKKPKKR
jgi:tetratricopeptide (TPR) repeat protein